MLHKRAEFSFNFIVSVFVNLSISSFVAYIAFNEGQRSIKEAERGDTDNMTALIEGLESDSKIVLLRAAQKKIDALNKESKNKIHEALQQLLNIPIESQRINKTINGEFMKRVDEYRLIFIKTKDTFVIKDIFKRI